MNSSWFRALAAAGLMAMPGYSWAADETKPAEAKAAETKTEEAKPAADAKPPQADRGELFGRLDKNNDGFLTADEVPEQNKRMF